MESLRVIKLHLATLTFLFFYTIFSKNFPAAPSLNFTIPLCLSLYFIGLRIFLESFGIFPVLLFSTYKFHSAVLVATGCLQVCTTNLQTHTALIYYAHRLIRHSAFKKSVQSYISIKFGVSVVMILYFLNFKYQMKPTSSFNKMERGV